MLSNFLSKFYLICTFLISVLTNLSVFCVKIIQRMTVYLCVCVCVFVCACAKLTASMAQASASTAPVKTIPVRKRCQICPSKDCITRICRGFENYICTGCALCTQNYNHPCRHKKITVSHV